MVPAHALVLLVTLALLRSAPAWAGDEGPRLPCDGPPAPSYAEPGAPPTVQAWRGKAAQEWQPPACSGWTAKGADMLVAVAGSFRHDGEIDDLLARIGGISTKSQVRYWSTTDKGWKPLVTEAFALSGPDPALRRAWIASRLRMPFHIAISTPAIAICLRRMAATENRRRCATR